MRLGWKVLNKHRGSMMVGSGCSWYRLYPLNSIVKPAPECGPLAVFKDYDAAFRFYETFGGESRGDQIVKIVYTPSKKTKLWGAPGGHDSPSGCWQNIPGADVADEVLCIT